MKYKGFDYELKENDGKWTFVLTHTKYSEDADTKEDAIRKVQDYIDNNLVSNMEKFKEKVLAYRNKFKKESYKEDVDGKGKEIRIGYQHYNGKYHVTVFGGTGFNRNGNLYQQDEYYKSFDNEDDAKKYVKELEKKFGVKKESYKEEFKVGDRIKSGKQGKDKGKIIQMYNDGSLMVRWDSGDETRVNSNYIKKESLDEIDKITMDVPLLTRMLEYFNENSMDDVKLHKILENLIRESKNGVLGIGDYENIIRIEGEEEPIKTEEERYDNISQDKLDEIIKYIEENKNRSNLILKAAIKHYFNEEIDEADILKYKKGVETKTESEKTDTIEVDGEKIVVVISGSGNKAVSTEDNRHFAKVNDKWVIDFTEKYAKQEKKESVIVIFNRSVDKDKVRDFKRDADKALGYNFIENDNEPYLFTFNDMDENVVKGLLKRNNLQRGDFQIKTKVNTYEKLKQLKEEFKKITNPSGLKFGGYISPDNKRIKHLDVGIGNIVSDGEKWYAIELQEE